jgi:hypothetical protein
VPAGAAIAMNKATKPKKRFVIEPPWMNWMAIADSKN